MNIPKEIHVYFHFDKIIIEWPKIEIEYIEGMNIKEEEEVKEGLEDLKEVSS